MTTVKSAHLIANLKSGKGRGAELPAIAQKVCDELGVHLRIYTASEKAQFDANIQKAVQNAREEGSIVLAAGGDGTLRSVAQVAFEQGVNFGAIAVGTFNFFARNHNLPEDPEQALRVALTAPVVPVRLGQVNGQIFLINASIGMYARSIAEREQSTHRWGRNRAVAIFSTVKTMLRRHRHMHADFETTSAKIQRRTPMIFIGNNYMQLKDLAFNVAECMKLDLLAVVLFREVTPWATFRILARSVFKKIESEPDVETFCIREMSIQTRRHSHDVALDGEMFHMQTPLVVKVLPHALRLAGASERRPS